jgi:transglutaminase-like putative cysteine protease
MSMSRKAREIETLLLAMLAVVPLYFTYAVGVAALIAFQVVMAAIVVRLALGRGTELIPSGVMRVIAILYIPFYAIDAAFLSRSAIAASTNLILFVSAYQAMEPRYRDNYAQRLLTTSVLFIASIATATHITILPFVALFAFGMLRQLMYVSHMQSIRSVGAAYSEQPTWRAAGFYLCGTVVIATALFPVMPRVRNPLLPGMAGPLGQSTTGLSDTIDFSHERTITADPTVIARVWMGPEAIPFFTPLRLRGSVYDTIRRGVWRQRKHEFALMETRNGVTAVARPSGFTRHASIQQRYVMGTRLLLPVGTYAISGPGQIYEAATDVFMTWQIRGELVSYDVDIARETLPLRTRRIEVCNYPVTPPVAAMARRIVGNETDPMKQADRIESYLSSHFRYVPNPANLGGVMTVDDFLLKRQRGHCEYFAAGMVALMTSLNVPARIAGGFYGGKLNPLGSYFIIRKEDAHAWVEVWDGKAWQTFDPTPPTMRPGSDQSGLIAAYATALSDSVNYFWDRHILTFGLADQITLATNAIYRTRELLDRMRGGTAASVRQIVSARYLTLVMIVLGVGLLLSIAIRRRRSMFELLAERLAAFGIEVGPAMTIEEAVAELERQRPDAAAALRPLMALYEQETFSPRHAAARRRDFRRRLGEIRG